MKPEARVFEIVLVTHQAQKILFGVLSYNRSYEVLLVAWAGN